MGGSCNKNSCYDYLVSDLVHFLYTENEEVEHSLLD